jgi:hypothetical protein
VDFGIDVDNIVVTCAGGPPAMSFTGAATSSGGVPNRDPKEDAKEFVEDLVRRGRLDDGGRGRRGVAMVMPTGVKTHCLVEDNGVVRLMRTRIDCGLRNRPAGA